MKLNIRLLYLYLFSFVGLLIVVIGSINMVNLGLKTFVFKEADRYEVYPPMVKVEGENQLSEEEQKARQDKDLARQRQREFSDAVAMILVGTPLYLYHWKTIQREGKESKKEKAA
jgi:hypothetical protein